MGHSPHLTTLCLFVHIHHPTELLFAKICLVLSMPSSAPELQGSESQLGIVQLCDMSTFQTNSCAPPLCDCPSVLRH